jgi:hypothetical protein
MRLDLTCADCGHFLEVTKVTTSQNEINESTQTVWSVKPCYSCTAALKAPIEALRVALEPTPKKRK